MYVSMAYHVILQELFFTEKRRKEITDLSKLEYSDVIMLLSNSENREHLKNFRNVDCVQANHNKVKDTQANLKTPNKLPLLFAV